MKASVLSVRGLVSTACRRLAFAALLGSSLMAAAETNQPTSLPIDLPTALRLAGAQNLDVQLARERLNEARAQHDQAVYQFFPWLAPGLGYRRTDGQVQEIAGTIFNASKQQYTVGATLGAQFEIGETWFKALAAKQIAEAADHALEAQRQESVYLAATSYFDLIKARALHEVNQEAVRIAEDYARQLDRGVQLGRTFKGDALRAVAQTERNRLAAQQAREQQRLTAARLAQVLRLDPAVELLPADSVLLPLTLLPNTALDSLVAQAVSTRPELKQNDSLVLAARKNKDAVTIGPWIPGLGAQAFLGGLGGGVNSGTGNFGDSQNYQLTLGWRVGPGGLFDPVRRRASEARVQSAQLASDKAKDAIVREVVEAHTHMHALAGQLATLKRALTAAEQVFRLTRERKEQAVGMVLENIFAEQDLTRTRTEFLATVAEFNKSQYTLQRAIGGALHACKSDSNP